MERAMRPTVDGWRAEVKTWRSSGGETLGGARGEKRGEKERGEVEEARREGGANEETKDDDRVKRKGRGCQYEVRRGSESEWGKIEETERRTGRSECRVRCLQGRRGQTGIVGLRRCRRWQLECVAASRRIEWEKQVQGGRVVGEKDVMS